MIGREFLHSAGILSARSNLSSLLRAMAHILKHNVLCSVPAAWRHRRLIKAP